MKSSEHNNYGKLWKTTHFSLSNPCMDQLWGPHQNPLVFTRTRASPPMHRPRGCRKSLWLLKVAMENHHFYPFVINHHKSFFVRIVNKNGSFSIARLNKQRALFMINGDKMPITMDDQQWNCVDIPQRKKARLDAKRWWEPARTPTNMVLVGKSSKQEHSQDGMEGSKPVMERETCISRIASDYKNFVVHAHIHVCM